MGKIICHNREQKAKIYQIVPTENLVSSEFIVYLEKCSVCGNPAIEVHKFDIWNKKINISRVKSKSIPYFLKQITIIRECRGIGNAFPIGAKRFFLKCSVFGKIEKCYQNLSTLKIGLIDPDAGLNYKINYK